MSKETKVKEQENEEIADAKAGAVATVGASEVSTQVSVRGASIRYATMTPFYSVSSVPQECAQECREGDWYLKTGKTSAWKFAGSGKRNAVKAFVIDAKEGILEGMKGASQNIPRSWSVGRQYQTPDGVVVPKDLKECFALARAETNGAFPFYRFEDFNKVTNPIPEHYLARCVYLEMLVEVPDTFAGDVSLYKIGGSAYTPVRILLKKFDPIKVEQFFRNIQVKEEVRHRGDKDWKWSPYGQCVSVYSNGVPFKRPNGADGYLWVPTVEARLSEDGKLYAPSAEEKADLVQFQLSLAGSVASVDDVDSGEIE